MNKEQDAIISKKTQMEAKVMLKIQIGNRRIITNQKFRQALIEGHTSIPQGERIDSSVKLFPGFEYVHDVLAGLKIGQVGLKDRLNSLFRAVLPRSDREASIWRVFSIEYGPDAPITRAIDSKANPNQLQNFVDHYQRRG
ncbi:MAG: hypothetical protein AMJ56_06615 [Anaerolineae bacterium SG8_19]|nr:MAG: hypothetical protein AMJ56_06615 [Anaerolineae bacterium SG8_19]